MHTKRSAWERGGIHYTARVVHTKHRAGKGGGGAYILLPGACTLNTVLGRGGEDIHFTARGFHTKHSAGERGEDICTLYCQGRAH